MEGKNVIELLQKHRSIRKFSEEKISDEIFRTIIKSGQSAPSSSNGQSYSIINVRKKDIREQLSFLAGNQQHIIDSSHFLIFCADLNRLENITLNANEDITEILDSAEMHLISTVDATLVAQNIAIAAESLDLGIVYIGGIRNNPIETSELLNLPYRVYPIFGMCIGYPMQENIPATKPRLPIEAVLHEDTYNSFEEKKRHIDEYDQIMKNYYSLRTGGSRLDTWSDTITDKRKVPRRMHIKQFLNNRGFSKR